MSIAAIHALRWDTLASCVEGGWQADRERVIHESTGHKLDHGEHRVKGADRLSSEVSEVPDREVGWRRLLCRHAGTVPGVLTLFHDYTSPASAVAVARLQRLAEEGLDVEFASLDAFGVDLALPVTLDVKASLRDLRPIAEAEGISLAEPPALPPTARAHVVEELAEAAGCGGRWRAACYRALWADAADLADAQVLVQLAEQTGLPQDVVLAALADRSLVTAMRRRSTAHRREGVGGVPTILAQRTLVPGLLDEADLRALAALG